MTLLEEGAFFLDNRAEVVLLECIYDCLGCDRVVEGVVDEWVAWTALSSFLVVIW